MQEYAQEFVQMNQKKKDMLQAEKLFDIPMSDYTSYDSAYKDFQGMQLIFTIYHNQQVPVYLHWKYLL